MCKDVPAPGTGYKCLCPAGTALEGNVCIACVRIVAGNGSLGYSGDGDLATKAELNRPVGVSVNDAGDIYIAGERTVCTDSVQTVAHH